MRLSGNPPYRGIIITEMMSQISGKAIHFPPHWNPEVIDLIKGMTRPVPHERLNIHQIVNHQVFKKHLDDFKKPLTKNENDILVRNFILNLQGNYSREVPEVIARELISRNSVSAKSDRQTHNKKSSLANFFDDIQEIKKSFLNDLNSDGTNYEPKVESKRNILGASSKNIIPLNASVYESNSSFFGNQIVPVVDDNFKCDFPSITSSKEVLLDDQLNFSNSEMHSSPNGTFKQNEEVCLMRDNNGHGVELKKDSSLIDETSKGHAQIPLFNDFVKNNTKHSPGPKIQTARSYKLAKSANISETRMDAELQRESIYHGKPVPIMLKASPDRKQVVTTPQYEHKVLNMQPVTIQNSDRQFKKNVAPYFINEPRAPSPIRAPNVVPNFAPPNNSFVSHNNDFIKKLVINDPRNQKPQIHLSTGQKMKETVLQPQHAQPKPYIVSQASQLHQVFGQTGAQQFIKTGQGLVETPIRNQTDLSHLRIVAGPALQQSTEKVRTLSASRLLQEPTSYTSGLHKK